MHPDDYQKLWLKTLLFKKNTLIQMLPTTFDKELLKYTVISSNLCFTLSYENSKYYILCGDDEIGANVFALYSDALNYMWSTISK